MRCARMRFQRSDFSGEGASMHAPKFFHLGPDSPVARHQRGDAEAILLAAGPTLTIRTSGDPGPASFLERTHP
jgi:hypothetical protein